ncbi:MAG: aldo/keto reductase, partial [Pyrinomonadaceae bacterium]
MKYATLGKSGYEISRIGFGAWQAGGGGWAFAVGPQDDRDSTAAIHRALDSGINWIDTAPLYGLGHSEEIVADAVEGMAERPYIFTKCGMPWDETGRVYHDITSGSIKRECEASLRRLRVETIDLYQIHWNKPAEQVEDALETLVTLRDEGKIRHIGVSNFNLDEMGLAKRIADPVCLQPPYSLIDREVEDEVLPFCGANSIGVIVYSPMGSGLLSGKMTRERIASLPDDDLRRHKSEFQEPQLTANLALVERLRSVSKKHDCSVAEAAVAWTLQNPNVTGAIVGL